LFDLLVPPRDLDSGEGAVRFIGRGNCRRRVGSVELRRQHERDVELMYNWLKVQSVCAKTGWDEETILASLDDVDFVGVAATPAMAQPVLPPTSSPCPLPIVSGPVVIFDAPVDHVDCSLQTDAVLTANCQLDGSGAGHHVGNFPGIPILTSGCP
jgi:hypothetical protein